MNVAMFATTDACQHESEGQGGVHQRARRRACHRFGQARCEAGFCRYPAGAWLRSNSASLPCRNAAELTTVPSGSRISYGLPLVEDCVAQ